MDIEEILERKQFLEDYHSGRIAQQEKEDSYYKDKFDVPTIKTPLYISRTGTGGWLVDGPTAHIITRNPQVFIEPKKDTEKGRDSAFAVNAFLNYWVRRILMQVPQPYHEFVKKVLLRGEGWIHPILNEKWDSDNVMSLPVLFPIVDPLNVFGSPSEDNGIPEYVMVKYERMPWQVQVKYPWWTNPKHAGDKSRKATVSWFEYWDGDVRYFSADEEPVLKGEIQPNVYKLTPFIHAYSGFGDASPNGEPESLAVGRLRKVMDLLLQECTLNSHIDSTIAKYAHPRMDLILPEGAEGLEEEIKKEYDMGAGSFNVLPYVSELKAGEQLVPPQEVFQHFNNIRSRISMEAPPIMAGLPSGSSGRQEDIVGTNFIRRFDSVVEATEIAFAKSMDMAIEILKVIPSMLPITQWIEKPDGSKGSKKITKDDFESVLPSKIILKTADPIEDDRKLMSGRILKNEKSIDWGTFLVEYAGYTPERASEIINQTIADMVIMENPQMLQLLAQKAMEKLGMAEELAQLEQQVAQQEAMGAGSQGGQPRSMNIQTPQGREMIDMALSQRGVRRPPL